MIGEILKTEVIEDENGAYTVKCLISKPLPYIDCSMVIGDEFGTEESADEIDERNEWEIRADENNINWLLEKLRCNGDKMERKFVEEFYNDFVKGEMIYHRLEDFDTLNIIIKTFNYLLNRKI